MKRHFTLTFEEAHFTWLDLLDPTEKDLSELAKKFEIDKTFLRSCMDPQHVPKFEKGKDYLYLIFRYFDEQSPAQANSVQELTRKMVVFWCKNFLITIHRTDVPGMAAIRKKWSVPLKDFIADENLNQPQAPQQIFLEILDFISSSFEKPLADANDLLGDIEMSIFETAGASAFQMEKAYYLKRQAAIIKRIIRGCVDVMIRFQNECPQIKVTSIKEVMEKNGFYAEELSDNTTGLMNLYLSMSSQKTNEASHRTNEIVRVLTVVSLFFLPLNFIAGVYGMNFEHMPELKWVNGYYGALLLMVGVAVALYAWFSHKGWLRSAMPEANVKEKSIT